MKNPFLHILCSLILGCGVTGNTDRSKGNTGTAKNTRLKTATFAGGCFWCVEADFKKLPGVIKATSGYSGGTGENPTYENYHDLGYIEAVQVLYDPDIITYESLLDYFWKHIDPTDAGGQFADRGVHYSSKIYYHNEEQKKIAERSRLQLEESKRFDKPVVTEITKFKNFSEAEEYHQNYCATNPAGYKNYRSGSGRDRFLKKVWGDEFLKITPGDLKIYSKPDDSVLKKKLTELQYHVTRNKGTEPPFDNEFWDNKKDGIYVDIISGEPLFSSRDKYDSGTGWPSFSGTLEPGNIVTKSDNSLFMKRTEVRSRTGDSHLGHLFTDGPAPTGLRYCMNSASLKFIPKEEMEKNGYGKYLKLFK